MDVRNYFPIQHYPDSILSHCICRIFQLAAFYLFSVSSHAAQPLLTETVITDVTDRSFSLVWTSDQVGQPIIEVYSDAAGTLPVTGISIKPYDIHTGNPAYEESSRQTSIDSIVAAAQSLGIVKTTTTGLLPATTYYVKFGLQADATLETTLCPDAGAGFCPDTPADLLSFTTEQSPARATPTPDWYLNDVLLSLNISAQPGELIVVNTESSSHPLSAFVGDGISNPYALLDLNNLYSSASNSSHKLTGSNVEAYGDTGEGLVVRHYKGTSGSETSIQAVNVSTQLGAIMTPIDRKHGDCNSDGALNSYDYLLLANAVAGSLAEADYASVAFHPIFCNFYKEAGINNIATTVVLDNEDTTRLEDVLLGKTTVDIYPEAP